MQSIKTNIIMLYGKARGFCNTFTTIYTTIVVIISPFASIIRNTEYYLNKTQGYFANWYWVHFVLVSLIKPRIYLKNFFFSSVKFASGFA